MDNLWIAALDPADRKRIEPHLHERPFAQGQMLYDAGEAVEEVWFPMSGVVSLMTLVDDDRMVQVRYSEPAGDLIPVGDRSAPFSAGGAPREDRP